MSAFPGMNTITLNPATISAAMQHYFDTVVFQDGKAPVVVGVAYNPGTAMFDVRVKASEMVA